MTSYNAQVNVLVVPVDKFILRFPAPPCGGGYRRSNTIYMELSKWKERGSPDGLLAPTVHIILLGSRLGEGRFLIQFILETLNFIHELQDLLCGGHVSTAENLSFRDPTQVSLGPDADIGPFDMRQDQAIEVYWFPVPVLIEELEIYGDFI